MCFYIVEIYEGVYIARLSIQSCVLAEHACNICSNVGIVTAEACHYTHQNVAILTKMAIALTVALFCSGDWSPICISVVQHMESLSILSTVVPE